MSFRISHPSSIALSDGCVISMPVTRLTMDAEISYISNLVHACLGPGRHFLLVVSVCRWLFFITHLIQTIDDINAGMQTVYPCLEGIQFEC